MLACDVCAKRDKLSPAYEYIVSMETKDNVVKFTPLSIALCKDCSNDTHHMLIEMLEQRVK